MEPPRPAEERLDPQLHAYLSRVHKGLYSKRVELLALEGRHEPPTPVMGVTTKRPKPDARQRPHIMRRYDESLCYLTGFAYNPKWAHFDRDAYGTGRLQFEDGVSLLGTTRAQDRWLEQHEPPMAIRESTALPTVHRGARIDAFFAMFAQRQEQTLLVGMAPLCVFVGQQFPTPLRLPGLRVPPRPKDRRIPLHRYARLCVSVAHQSRQHGEIHAIVIGERTPSMYADAPARYSVYLLASGEAVARDPSSSQTGWLSDLTIDVANAWQAAFQGRSSAYQIFESSELVPFDLVNADPEQTPWAPACPGGDAQMLFRAGLLLESPDLEYSPWNRGVLVGSLDRMLLAVGVTKTQSLTMAAWMKYTLMTRAYPYVLLAQQDMTENLHYEAYTADVPLNPNAVKTFQATVVPDKDTYWREEERKRLRAERARKRRQKQREQQQAGSAVGLDMIGVNGGRRGLASIVRRRSGKGRTPRRQQQPPPGRGVVISRPTLRTERTREIRALVRAPTTVGDRMGAVEARFLAVRMAFEAVSRNDPLYVTSGEVWNEQEAYTLARQWRKAILQSRQMVLSWAMAVGTLELLYPDAGNAIWAAGEKGAGGSPSFARARWAQRLETRAPKGASSEYMNLARRPLRVKPFVPVAQWRSQGRRGPQRQALKDQDAALREKSLADILARSKTAQVAENLDTEPTLLLLRVARGTTPPDRGVNHADLQIMALAAAVSLIRDGLLFLAPPPYLWSIQDRPKTALEQDHEDRLPLLWTEQGREAVGGEGGAKTRSEATLQSMATFALLAWEWGQQPGLARYLAWLDDMAARLGHTLIGADERISSRLVSRYDVLDTLLAWSARPSSASLSTPSVPPSPKYPPVPDVEEEPEPEAEPGVSSELANLILYTELLYGYRPGTLVRAFQELANQYAAGRALRPDRAKSIKQILPALGGLGQQPEQQGYFFAGWTPGTIYKVNLANLRLHFQRAATTTTARPESSSSDIGSAAPGTMVLYKPVVSVKKKPKNTGDSGGDDAGDIFTWLRSGP